MDSAVEKHEIRRRLLTIRGHVAPETRRGYSQRIVDHAITLVDWKTVHRVHCYVPMLHRNEVDTWSLLHYLWQRWPNITTIVPGPLMRDVPTSHIVTADTDWNTKCIPPLPLTAPHTSNKADVIIVPMLGFDQGGNRLGYGGGYYDRLLANKAYATVIGLCFSAGLVRNGLPHEPHDKLISTIVTESQVYRI